MSPLFYEDSLGAKLAEKADAAMNAAHEAENEFVEDPEALARAEAEVCDVDPEDDYKQVTADWVVAFGPSKLSGLIDSAGFTARLLTGPLETADIPHVWDPYPPEEMPSFRVGYGAVDRPFSLLVPADRLDEARELITGTVGSAAQFGMVASPGRTPQAAAKRRHWSWFFFWVFIGFDLLLFVGYALARILHLVD